MKVMINDKQANIQELSDLQKKIIASAISDDELQAKIEKRINALLTIAYKTSLSLLKSKWLFKFREEGLSIPVDDAQFIEQIFQHKDYKPRVAAKSSRKLV